jgi:hypothetical protein
MKGILMAVRRNLNREIRAWWATLAAICLLGAGVAYGVTRYQQGELERDATREARKVAVESLQPLLDAADVAGPIRGGRYEELVASVREEVMAGPIVGVRLWAPDGTILFAETPDLVGRRDAAMRDEIQSAVAGTPQGFVDGVRYRVLVPLRVGDPAEVVAAELDRSHTAIVAESEEQWYPWTKRGLTAAAVFAGLSVLTVIVFGLLGLLQRRGARPKEPKPESRPRRAVREPVETREDDLPPYMQPGFQAESKARRRVEEELDSVTQERDSLRSRVRHLEAEVERAKVGANNGGGRPEDAVTVPHR